MKLLISFCSIDHFPQSQRKLSPLAVLDTERNRIAWVRLSPIQGILGITGLAQNEKYLFAICQKLRDPEVLTLAKKDFSLWNVTKLKRVKDPHSICMTGEHLYVVSSGNDSIFRYKIHYGRDISLVSRRRVWKPKGSSGIADKHHVNAISTYGKTIVASAFGPKRGKLKSGAKEGYVIDIKSNKKLLTKIFHPHSVFLNKDAIYYCESTTKTVYQNGTPFLKFRSGYVRGLAKTNDSYIVGLSRYRQRSKSTGLVTNPFDVGGKLHQICQVVIVESKNVIYSYDLSKFFGEIYDILILDDSTILANKNVLKTVRLPRKYNNVLRD